MSNEADSRQKQTLLIVDDTPDNITVLSALLKNEYRIKVATHGARALEIAGGGDPPDMVLLDIMMPEMDGYAVCERLKADERLREIPVIFLSALNEAMDKVKAFQAGGVDYVTKPFQAEEVRARVETHLKIRQLQIELEKRNQQLQESFAKLEALNEQKDEFMRIASHDLKNPLTSILGFASLIKAFAGQATAPPHSTEEFAEKIKGNCRVMEKIINDFLDFQAMEDGRLTLVLEPVDLNESARMVLENNGGQAEKKGISLSLELDPSLPQVRCDKSRITQVMENFVSNAIKFSPADRKVCMRTRSAADAVSVEVQDAGPGLTDDDMQKLFKKYAKLSSKPTGGEKSSGLGLAIAKKVVDLHGGRIGARNNPTECGATFWFELRLSDQT